VTFGTLSSSGLRQTPRRIMTVKRMDNVGIVVEDIDAAIEFFTELGLELEGVPQLKELGRWRHWIARHARRDCHDAYAGRSQPTRAVPFPRAAVVADHRSAPVNALGYLRVMFTVEDIDDTLVRLGKRGAKLVGEVVQYENMYRLCYIRGPKEFSSASPNSSGSRPPERIP
jgi:catechol 2,3-dioxygenase-like lactoylglutathione lyase family enzyme